MIIKKFYGSNIEHARQDARQNLGNDFIILETVMAQNNQPACITVMVDNKKVVKQTKNPIGSQVLSNFKNTVYQRSDAVLKPIRNLYKTEANADTSPEEAPVKTTKVKLSGHYEPVTAISKEQEINTFSTERLSKRPTALFEQHTNRRFSTNPDDYKKEDLKSELDTIKDKIGHLEKLLSEHIVLTNTEWISESTFQQLLQAGIPANIIGNWYRIILESGVSPKNDPEKFMIGLAELLRESLPAEATIDMAKNLVFVGNAGSGKTNLIMKILENKDLAKASKPAVIDVSLPGLAQKYTILELFAADHDLPFYKISSGAEISKLIPLLENYDLVLIDTPSINFHSDGAFEKYWKLRQLLSAIQPLETHFVMNVNSRTEIVEYRKNNPMQPDFIDITHLDEISQWGSSLPIINYFNCPVRFTSEGPGNIEVYKATTFANTILLRS